MWVYIFSIQDDLIALSVPVIFNSGTPLLISVSYREARDADTCYKIKA